MSHRLGSSISSPLFLVDPVSTHNNVSHNNSYINDHSFLVKGEESPTTVNVTPESPNNNDETDVLIISGKGESFKLNRNTLREALQELKSQAHVSLRQLNPEQTELFRSIVEALRLLYGSQGLYDIIITDIRNVFNDVKDIKPGTVAAFFIGCFNDDKFPGPMGCSPKCAASFPPTEGTPGYTNCDDLVLIYSDGLFSSLNEKQSSHAYIYIDDPEFAGFTTENINQLRSANIENCSLIFGNQDGSYREVTGALSLNQLPRKSEITVNKNQVNSNDNGSNSSGSTGIIFLIVIIIIMILLLIILYRNYNPRW